MMYMNHTSSFNDAYLARCYDLNTNTRHSKNSWFFGIILPYFQWTQFEKNNLVYIYSLYGEFTPWSLVVVQHWLATSLDNAVSSVTLFLSHVESKHIE